MRVFSYGSNMLSLRLKAPDRAPHAVKIGVGHSAGRKLTFSKRSIDQSGKCDAQRTGKWRDRVYGVVFDVPLNEMPPLRTAEGHNNGYSEETIRITLRNGRKIRAHAFIAEAHAIDPKLKPYRWYHNLVTAGAAEHRLPAKYIAGIRAAATKPDPLPSRPEKMAAQRILRKHNAT